MAISFDLKAHDAQFHPNGFVEGKNRCKFREDMKKYESVDDLSKTQEITDALEDSEVLEEMISLALAPENKKSLEEKLKDTQAILDAILGKTGAKSSSAQQQFGPTAPIPHDKKAFPDKKDAKWQDALANYGNSGYGWKSAGSGSTQPHYIDFNGKRYFVKKAGMNPSYTKEAARNEANANNFLRLAGLNAPDSMYMKSNDGGRFCISAAADISGGELQGKLGDKAIASKVREAYPIMALMYNMDIMQNADNAYVDKNGNPLFLNNGSTFGFSAQGDRNKRFDYDQRDNPFPSKSTNGGLTGLLDVGNNSSQNWNFVFGGNPTTDDILKECAKYDMGDLVKEALKQGLLKQVPKNGQDALVKYAEELDKLSSKFKQPKQAAPAATSPAATSPAAASSGQNEIEKLAKKYGLSVPTLKDNGDGTKTLTGFGTNVDFNKLRDFVNELNDRGLIPGFLASLSQNGTMTAAPAINQSTLANQIQNLSGISLRGSQGLVSTLSGVSAGGSVSFGGGMFPSAGAASNFASLWNASNANSGYTAKATQNTQTGQWEITLYPTNHKQIAKTYGTSKSSSASTSSSSAAHAASVLAGRAGLSAKAAARLQRMAGAKSAQPQAKQPQPAPVQAPAPAQAPSPAPAPAPQQPTRQAQSAAPAPQKGLKGIQRLQRMMNAAGATPAQKAAYQAMLNKMVSAANSGASA